MIAITSPAKTQDFESKIKHDIETIPEFLDTVDAIANDLSSLSKSRLKKLFGVSDTLAELNYSRYQNWDNAPEKPCILAYKGDIYRQFDADTFSKEEQHYVQSHLRIITGLYGILRPYDLMKPYRLEMKTPAETLKSVKTKKLQDFWRESITEALNSKLKDFPSESRILLNLASKEYADAIDFEKIEGDVVEVAFRQKKNGEIKNLGIYAKIGRGHVINYMIQNQVSSIDDLEKFNIDGYTLHARNEDRITFIKQV